jgi:hypothetical protein
VAPLFAEVVSRMQNKKAIGDLMDAVPDSMLSDFPA